MTCKRIVLNALFSLSLFMLAGCGGSDRPALAPASGIVKLDGEPVEGASVTYHPVEGGRPGSGTTDAQGRYTIKTFQDAPGAAVGDHIVTVMKISGPGAFVIQGDAPATAPSSSTGESDGSDSLSEIPLIDPSEPNQPEIIYDVPQRYMSPKESDLKVTVPETGSDSLHLDLAR
tara:strand:- start:13508 stop:14029 length:522 start_codon:yes stop_codon:yes gene_type:complete